ncbi:MAG: ATP-grasp domain-containing protein [Ruminococcus sp.]|nr:ATP-grasp domain-containing protein [Ruminococcus sp.]
MVVGLCYDLQGTYDLSGKLAFKDFSFLSEVEFVEMSLRKLGHKVILINGLDKFVKNIDYYKKECDLIFNMIEGVKSRNREGLLPAVCEAFNILYTGSDAFGLSLSLNKYHMGRFVESFDIKTPVAHLIEYPITNYHFADGIMEYPCVIKPNHEGSGTGVYLIYSKAELVEKADLLTAEFGQQLVVEEYIPGNEVSVSILGTSQHSYVYACLEFVNKDGSSIELFDYESKYVKGFETISPQLESEVIDLVCSQSLMIHNKIGFRDISRIDWKIKENIPYFIEATPLPALDKNSDFDIGSRMRGRSFEDVINDVLISAMSRRNA